MYILLPCPTIKDKFILPASSPELNALQEDINRGRTTLKAYSDIEYLFKKIQEGDVIMARKVEFDNYLKKQVDAMRACVYGGVPCPFEYNGYMNSDQPISMAGRTAKEQWAVEMVMSRYNLSSIYHAAAYSSLEFIFAETAPSFTKIKDAPKFINNLQVAFKYFNEGFQPLKRLAEAYPALEQLIKNPPLEARREIFFTIKDLVAINLCYLKLEKYRVMTEYRSCK